MGAILTKDADALICLLYKGYCESVKDGISKTQARSLGSSEDIFNSLAPKWTYDDVDNTCRELSRSGLVYCQYADDVAHEVWFTDAGIIYMENRFKRGLDEVLDYLGKIKGLIPFI